MIPVPGGWTALLHVDGVTVIPPQGPNAALVRYTERLRPLASAEKLLAERLASHRRFKPDSVPSIERIITVEGEYGAFVTVQGSLGQTPAQYSLGLVFGDDFYARTEGFCMSAELLSSFSAAARECTLGDRHLLGVRRRRFLYASNGWRAISRGFLTDWLCPDYPKVSGVATVYPAIPLAAGSSAVAALVARGISFGAPIQREKWEPITTHPSAKVRLVGHLVEARGVKEGGERLYSVVVFEDSRFAYMAELVSTSPAHFDDHKAGFRKLWETFEAIPDPTAVAATAAAIVLPD